jgi:hypothetical protein
LVQGTTVGSSSDAGLCPPSAEPDGPLYKAKRWDEEWWKPDDVAADAIQCQPLDHPSPIDTWGSTGDNIGSTSTKAASPVKVHGCDDTVRIQKRDTYPFLKPELLDKTDNTTNDDPTTDDGLTISDAIITMTNVEPADFGKLSIGKRPSNGTRSGGQVGKEGNGMRLGMVLVAMLALWAARNLVVAA